jgi:hypothetical protein
MATFVVDTDGGGSYATMASAESALPATFTSNNTITCTGATDDTSDPFINGSAISPYRLFIEAASTDRHDMTWDDGKYILKMSSSGSFYIREAFVTVDGLQIDGSASSDLVLKFNDSTSATDSLIFRNSIVKGGTNTFIIIDFDSRPLKFINNVFVITDSGQYVGSNSAHIFNNCVVYGDEIDRGFRNAVCTNCIVSYTTSSTFDAFYDCTGTNNISSDSSAPGYSSTGAINIAASAIFEDAPNDDFRIISTSPTLNAGATLSYAFDAIGTTRPQGANWDIGAIEFVSGGGTTVLPSTGSQSYSGQQPQILNPVKVQPSAGLQAYTGQQPTVITGSQVVVLPGTGSQAYTGIQPSILIPVTASPSTTSQSYTGQQPVIITGDGKVVLPVTGAQSYIGRQPLVLVPKTASPSTGSQAYTGQQPLVLVSTRIEPVTGSQVYSGKQPLVLVPVTAKPNTALQSYTGQQPVIGNGEGTSVQPATGNITYIGLLPIVRTSVIISADRTRIIESELRTRIIPAESRIRLIA